MNLLDLVKKKRWADVEAEKDRILNIEETEGTTTLGFPRHRYRFVPQHTEPEALFPVMASEKEDKPILDLKKYGIRKLGQMTADEEIIDVWLVDGEKIKRELDSEWCSREDASGFVAGHPLVKLFKFIVPPNTIIVSNTRKTKREIQESIIHEYTEYLIQKRGLSYEEADPIAVQVERVSSQIFDETIKSNWQTMLEDYASPPHFKMGGRKEELIDILPKLVDYINKIPVSRLATISSLEKAQVTPVWHIFHNNNFYVAADGYETIKHKNITLNPNVALTVDDFGPDVGDVRGLTIQGKAVVLSDSSERNDIIRLFHEKYSDYSDKYPFDMSYPIYRIVVSSIAHWKLEDKKEDTYLEAEPEPLGSSHNALYG